MKYESKIDLINTYNKNTLIFFIYYRLNRLRKPTGCFNMPQFWSFEASNQQSSDVCMGIGLLPFFTSVISDRMSDILNVTSKSVFP